jgi:hypothetical protein
MTYQAMIYEAGQDVPVVRETDVLVCGGGPAGIAAAFTAARSGARVLLLERNPFLGGVWTAGALTILIDTENKGGLNQELRQRLEERGAAAYFGQWGRGQWPVYTLEEMKALLDEMVEETGIEVQLYTQVVAVSRQGAQIQGVFTESKSGREFIRAKVVIDTTGDGDVAARAGCAYEIGRPEDGKMQPMTLYGRIGGYKGEPVRIEPLRTIALNAGYHPSYDRVTLFPQPGQPGVFMLMATHLYGDGTNVRDLTTAEFEGRKEIRELFQIYKEHGGDDWKDTYLIDTGPFIGIRETRRIRGRYYLTKEDLKIGRQFEDGICRVHFNVDIHHPNPKEGHGLVNMPIEPYDIPYRSLLVQDIDNLLVAGRCISGDHIAMASYRVTGNAVAMGEAVGVAAAIAVESQIAPSDLDVSQLLSRLQEVRSKHIKQ